MRAGDTVFVHHDRDVQLYCEVTSVGDDEIVMEVINGGYTLYITKASPPKGQRDYNSAIEWYRKVRV